MCCDVEKSCPCLIIIKEHVKRYMYVHMAWALHMYLQPLIQFWKWALRRRAYINGCTPALCQCSVLISVCTQRTSWAHTISHIFTGIYIQTWAIGIPVGIVYIYLNIAPRVLFFLTKQILKSPSHSCVEWNNIFCW